MVTGYAEPVSALADRFWERLLRLEPTVATVAGDERYDDRLPDPSPRGRAELRELYGETIAETERVTAAKLSDEDRITLDVVRLFCQLALEQQERQEHVLGAVDQMEGPQALLTMLVQLQPADTPERLDRLVARLQAYPRFIEAHVANLREGLRLGLIQPRIVAERTVGQLERLLTAPAASPVVSLARVANEADRERLAEAARDHVLPAYRALLDAIRTDYLPFARDEPGLWGLPDGERRYAARIRLWTTLDLDAGELHRSGLEELESIESERRGIARKAGFGDDTASYRAALERDPSNVPRTPEEILGRMREDLRRAMAAAPRFFGRLPESPCEVRPLDPFQAADSLGYYLAPAPAIGRPGAWYMNTTELAKRTFSRYATITYHEMVPGHHLQLAIAAELEGLHPLRVHGPGHLVSGAYIEGWGLYSERLADELGLFRGPQERFGMLDAQAWRAARLVIDTGLHAFRWTREQAIRTLMEATGFQEADGAIEVDRYIVLPGQALAYKVGQREIERLRGEATERLGPRFDLRRFHDELIGHGSLPLATLARELPRWLGAGRDESGAPSRARVGRAP